jgi:pyridinium-3,5-biscarboxylic acid mononucleotide synthase
MRPLRPLRVRPLSGYANRMDRQGLQELLERVARGELPSAEAAHLLEAAPFADLAGFATVDHHRALREGLPEVILGTGKTPEQTVEIAKAVLQRSGRVLVTRGSPEQRDALASAIPQMTHDAHARLSWADPDPRPRTGHVAVVTAGTSDIPVAQEAALTAEMMGANVTRHFDVGVAGLHRITPHIDAFRRANALVVAAGMEGALPSVIGGLVGNPVIAVPTSVGYGASFGGLAALLGMLNSCATGVTVVNIDNGFGAGFMAATINRLAVSAPPAGQPGANP